MKTFLLTFVSFASFFMFQNVSSSFPMLECSDAFPETEKNSTITINVLRDTTGDWTTHVDTTGEFQNKLNHSVVEVSRKVIECDGKDIISITTTVTACRTSKRLKFFDKGAENVVVSNGGVTALRNNAGVNVGYGGILTNRPLRDDELFEVKLEEHTTEHEDSLGIGVTKFTPTTITYPSWMSSGTFMLYDNELYDNGVNVKSAYGLNIGGLRAGAKIGVMKKKNGDIHFFINGVDQGVAFSGITNQVYGVLDLYGSGVKASIA